MAAKKTTTKTKTKRYEGTAPHRVGQETRIARELDALRKVDPGQWRDKILNAVRENRGVGLKAAAQLSIGYRTFTRYVKEDDSLRIAIEKIRARVAAEEKSAKKNAKKPAAAEGATS